MWRTCYIHYVSASYVMLPKGNALFPRNISTLHSTLWGNTRNNLIPHPFTIPLYSIDRSKLGNEVIAIGISHLGRAWILRTRMKSTFIDSYSMYPRSKTASPALITHGSRRVRLVRAQGPCLGHPSLFLADNRGWFVLVGQHAMVDLCEGFEASRLQAKYSG